MIRRCSVAPFFESMTRHGMYHLWCAISMHTFPSVFGLEELVVPKLIESGGKEGIHACYESHIEPNTWI